MQCKRRIIRIHIHTCDYMYENTTTICNTIQKVLHLKLNSISWETGIETGATNSSGSERVVGDVVGVSEEHQQIMYCGKPLCLRVCLLGMMLLRIYVFQLHFSCILLCSPSWSRLFGLLVSVKHRVKV